MREISLKGFKHFSKVVLYALCLITAGTLWLIGLKIYF